MLSEIATMREVVNRQRVYPDPRIGTWPASLRKIRAPTVSPRSAPHRFDPAYLSAAGCAYTLSRPFGFYGAHRVPRWFHVKQPNRLMAQAWPHGLRRPQTGLHSHGRWTRKHPPARARRSGVNCARRAHATCTNGPSVQTRSSGWIHRASASPKIRAQARPSP
jgi:hypothetical protein